MIVRFLEQGPDVNSFDVHQYQVPDGRGGFYTRSFTCLGEVNQPCPGCTAGMKLKVRGVFNVIQRNRAQLRRDKDGKAIKNGNEYIVDGHADEVVVLNVPSTTHEELRKKDGTYHGLMSRDLMLSDSANTFQPWTVEPANIDSGPQPMSENDMALAARKHDIDAFMKPPTAQEAQDIVNKFGGNSGQQQGQQQGQQGIPAQGNAGAAQPANGFLAGANVPQTGSAFGAAQAAVVPPPAAVAPPVPVAVAVQQQQYPPTQQPAASPPPISSPMTPEGGVVPLVEGQQQPAPAVAPVPAPAPVAAPPVQAAPPVPAPTPQQ